MSQNALGQTVSLQIGGLCAQPRLSSVAQCPAIARSAGSAREALSRIEDRLKRTELAIRSSFQAEYSLFTTKAGFQVGRQRSLILVNQHLPFLRVGIFMECTHAFQDRDFAASPSNHADLDRRRLPMRASSRGLTHTQTSALLVELTEVGSGT